VNPRRPVVSVSKTSVPRRPRSLVADLYTALAPGGRLVLSFRDLTAPLTGTYRFIPVHTDVIAFGSEDAELFTVEVVPAVSGTPTGNVTVKNGAVAVCTIVLAAGNGCFLKPTQLRVGSYQITATYNGDSTYAASTSPAQPVTVVEALIRKNADR